MSDAEAGAATPGTGPAGPATPGKEAAAAAAVEWVTAVMDDGDLKAAWPRTHPTLRLVLVQHWILGYQGDPTVGPAEDWDALAAALATAPSTHPLWERFARERLVRWREYWGGFSAQSWKVADLPETAASDLEIVTFLERGVDLEAGTGRPVLARRLAMRRMPGGWMIAGLDGKALYRPGWPPQPAGPPPRPRPAPPG